MKECKNTVCFGPGFRKSSVVRSVSLFPSQRPEEIAVQVDPIESFRFEKVVTSDGESYRVRSDVSMLLHAADLAKRVGSSAAQYFMDSRRPKSSSIQEALDKLNPSDDELLSMVKSRHLQHPSEILAWVAPIDDSFLYNKLITTASDGSLIQWPFFKVNPNTLDDIFAVKADSTLYA